MRIRTMTPRDLDAAATLWAHTPYLGPVPSDEVTALLAHDAELVLVAERGDRLVGVVLGSFDGRRGWLNRLAVAASERRSGVGRALVHEVERRLAERGCVQVNLLVMAENDDAHAFWDALGYQRSGDVVLHTRRLDGAGTGSC